MARLASDTPPTSIERPPPVLHPEADQEWFRSLPHEQRARMNREWRTDLRHSEGLRRTSARKLLRAGGRHALGFALMNGFCFGDAAATYAAAACAGFLLGLVLEWRRVARLLSATVGLVGFVLFLWLTRGHLSVANLPWIVPVVGLCAYLGVRREME